jgi:ketosteroid isomerase-like protein
VNEDPRIKLIEDAFEGFARYDVAGIAEFLHPEVECHVAPPLLNVGTWHGPSGFVEMATSWHEPFGTLAYEMRGLELIDDRNVIVAVHQHGQGVGSGVPVELDVFYLLEFEGDRAIRFHVYRDREDALAAL